MDCDFCSRVSSPKLPFYCVTCARNHLYGLRLENAKVLIDKERKSQEVGKTIESLDSLQKGHSNRGDDDQHTASPRWLIENAKTRKAQSEERAQAMSQHSEVLKKQIQEMREEIKKRKAVLMQRRSDSDSVTHQIQARRSATIEAIEQNVKRKQQSWHSLHNKIAESRAFLCREAAKLHGLRQRKKRKGGEVREEYTIGGIPIVDLTDLNSMLAPCNDILTEVCAKYCLDAHPSQVTTSLTHVARLLVLVSHYLALRLPAEITLPHHGYPLATILTPSSSYSSRKIPFPGTTPSQSSTTSPTASRSGDPPPLPRPRPLFIEKKLPRLAQEDPTAYRFFLEGASLLAWDVAWVCRTQGIYAGTESWEDICAVGKNMWQLLVAPAPSPTLLRVLSSRDVQGKQKSGKEAGTAALPRSNSVPKFGHLSHGTAHSFLGGPEGLDLMRGWKFSKAAMVTDPLKKALLGEMSNAEWELLEEQEWDQGEPFNEDEAVVIRTRAMDESAFDKARGIMTAKPSSEAGDIGDDLTQNGRVKGVSGWTKLRGR